MIIGILGLLAAVAFWFGVGLVLYALVTSHDSTRASRLRREARARRETPPVVFVTTWAENQRQLLYDKVLDEPDEPDPLANHWSTGPYGYGPHGDLSRAALRKALGHP